MRDIAKRFARRLETQRANGHPVISTWGTGRISSTAIAWAVRFFTDQEPDINEFFEQRLWEAQPSKCSTPKLPEVDSGTSNTNAEEPAEA